MSTLFLLPFSASSVICFVAMAKVSTSGSEGSRGLLLGQSDYNLLYTLFSLKYGRLSKKTSLMSQKDRIIMDRNCQKHCENFFDASAIPGLFLHYITSCSE